MSRSRSMTGLNLNRSQELEPARVPRYRPFDRTLTRLKDNLDDSENRRVVLVHKLKEAQETLEVICAIEEFANALSANHDCSRRH